MYLMVDQNNVHGKRPTAPVPRAQQHLGISPAPLRPKKLAGVSGFLTSFAFANDDSLLSAMLGLWGESWGPAHDSRIGPGTRILF